MVNPAQLMKLMGMKKKFSDTHPKFAAFWNDMLAGGVEAGTILEITVTRPGKEPVTANMKVQPSDLEMIQDLKNMGKKKQNSVVTTLSLRYNEDAD